MTWQRQLHNDPLPWLLEPDDPGVRYLALRDLLDRPADDPELSAARRLAHVAGPIATVLDAMAPDGYWVEPGPGYLPKYRSTVWAVILLAQLGAWVEEDERVGRSCAYLLEHALAPGGQWASASAPSGTADCLQGNLCWALPALGCDDPRLEQAFEWMARTVTGEGMAPNSQRDAALRYYAGKCGPGFACGANNGLPCAWGAAKVMLAFGSWPAERRTPLVQRAIEQGVEFLLGVDPAGASYPSGYSANPSGNWWRFGFPVFYVTDILQIVESLAALGHIHDPRLLNALDLVRSKQDALGRWPLEYNYPDK
ncbi:MAG TPA: nitrogen fixation protein NifH, partial [Anaerolineae bacterium]|nr:nitrogen fixation protein NifH [Anaerolineae bacterium]